MGNNVKKHVKWSDSDDSTRFILAVDIFTVCMELPSLVGNILLQYVMDVGLFAGNSSDFLYLWVFCVSGAI